MRLSLLDRAVFSYQPIWGRSRQLVGVRLHVRLLDDEVNVPHLLHAIDDWWSAGSPRLLVALAEPRAVRQALVASAPEHLWIELPDAAQRAPADWRHLESQARRLGHRLVQRLPLAHAPRPVPQGEDDSLRTVLHLWPEQASQALAVVPAPTIEAGLLPGQIYEGIGQVALAAHCLDAAHAWGVVDWPIADALARHPRGSIGIDKGTLLRVQQALLRDASTERVLVLIHSDAVLTYRLLQLLNSDAFGRGRVLPSVRQAIGLLGERRLRDALTRLLALAVADTELLPARHTLALRARLMGQLMDAGAQQTLANDVLLTGLFATLDQWLRVPMAQLAERVPLSDAVRDALVEGAGPYAPYLSLAQRLADPAQSQALPLICQEAGFALETVNTALLRTLAQARSWG
jgi:hypothetical protein